MNSTLLKIVKAKNIENLLFMNRLWPIRIRLLKKHRPKKRNWKNKPSS